MKIISFSLWGDTPMYTRGALRNVELAREHFPGWLCMFHCDTTVPQEAVMALQEAGGRVILRATERGFLRLLWRFQPMYDCGADVVIVRDTDSRLSARDAAAVTEWEESGKAIHVMRTHPNHTRPIMGGLWGFRPLEMSYWLTNEIYNWRTAAERRVWPERENRSADGWLPPEEGARAFFNFDQVFLGKVVWPKMRKNSLIHDDYEWLKDRFDRKLPTPPADIYDFPGNKYDENDIPVYSLETR